MPAKRLSTRQFVGHLYSSVGTYTETVLFLAGRLEHNTERDYE